MTITYGELCLFVWGIVVTVLYLKEVAKGKEFKHKTVFMFEQIADGAVEVYRTNDGGLNIQQNKEK
jgi:hypothetical protein